MSDIFSELTFSRRAKSWPDDIWDMHDTFGFHEAVHDLTDRGKSDYLDFRVDFLFEEMDELCEAIDKQDADGVVDSLIDLCVVAIGTLDVFGVDPQEAWDRVHAANMTKHAGVNPKRPNPFGLPDLMKPEGFVSPNHAGNLGSLEAALRADRGPLVWDKEIETYDTLPQPGPGA